VKLPNFKKSAALNQLKLKMGINPDHYGSFASSSTYITSEERALLESGEGIEVSLDQLRILDDQTLAYKNSRVLLYIRDVSHYSKSWSDDLPRYHLANCATLQEMASAGRSSRYVIATETTGEFMLNFLTGRSVRAERKKLNVCQRCLDRTRFPGWNSSDATSVRLAFVRKFSPSRFFELFPKSLHMQKPKYTAHDAPLNVYTPDFSDISSTLRRQSDWECSDCRVKMLKAEHRKFLQTHHKNGARWDNRRENLEVLCMACHASRPHHSHMKSDPRYREFLALRARGEFRA
jgi:hypothetical protein